MQYQIPIQVLYRYWSNTDTLGLYKYPGIIDGNASLRFWHLMEMRGISDSSIPRSCGVWLLFEVLRSLSEERKKGFLKVKNHRKKREWSSLMLESHIGP